MNKAKCYVYSAIRQSLRREYDIGNGIDQDIWVPVLKAILHPVLGTLRDRTIIASHAESWNCN